MFGLRKRSDYVDRHSPRPKPKTPTPSHAPHVTGDIQHTVHYLNQTAGRSDDFQFSFSDINGRKAALAFYSTITDPNTIESILDTLKRHPFPKRISIKEMPEYIVRHVLTSGRVTLLTNLWEVREAISRGEAVLLVDGLTAAVAVAAGSPAHRAVEPPLIESSTRGPQIGFIEDLNVNIALIRSSLASDALTVMEMIVGNRSRTRVAVIYQHDVVNPTLLDTVIKRIEAVHVDKLTGSATLEQRIVDNHWTLFPLTRATSRLDNCIKEVGQGKVLIMVDGDATGFLVPGTISDFFQTMEDDQHSWIEATFVRMLRLISFFFALYLPALYISFTDYNPELMPHLLAMQIAQSRETVPFPAAIEVLIMQFVIEIIREATLRMPKVMGQTIGIVGGLVLGQAAVEAGLVSNILIVVIALTAVAVFVMPSYEFAAVSRLLCLLHILGAAFMGIYGVLLVTIGVLYHTYSLESFGAKYMVPINGEHWRDLFLDGIFRIPIPMLDRRASHLHDQEDTRGADYTDPVGHPMMDNPMRGEVGNNNRRMRDRRGTRT